MFRFFRQLRHRLLTDNRLSKYLFYAIGEIVLVVIGILIALQINTWNNDQLEKEAAVIFYQNIIQQLRDDRGNLMGQIEYNNRYYAPFEFAIRTIDSKNLSQKDSLSSIAVHLSDYSDFDREGNIYETIVASGDVQLIHNDQIKGRLRNLEETYLYINRIESIQLQFIMQLMPELLQMVQLTTGKPVDIEKLFGVELQNSFAIALRLMGEKGAIYDRAVREIDTAIMEIEAELGRLQ